MATFLVTGGAGFIGCNIVRTLVNEGESVVVLDNLSTGRRENLDDVIGSIRFIKGDIRDIETAKNACQGIDYVLHQAALRSVQRSVEAPLDTHDVNSTGTLCLLLAARDAQVKRVVLASSSSVYGNGLMQMNEETIFPAPISPYALTKLNNEHYAELVSNLYGLQTVCLRYFNVFGPFQNPESQYSAVIPIFVQCLQSGEAPTIHSTGVQSRDFTYVDNVVQANLLAARSTRVFRGDVYNIGNGEHTSINELFAMLQKLLGTSVTPLYGKKREGDVERTHADIRKAQRELEYQPLVPFKEGLKRSITWYKQNPPSR